MKRVFVIVLSLLLTLGLASAALAAEDGTEESVRRSVFAPAASMSENRGLFTEAEKLGLTAPLNRAVTAVVLARIAGAEETAPLSPACGDIDPAAWYAFGAQWAVEHGVLPAGEDGLFHPEQAVDREGLCLAMDAWLSATGRSLNIINAWYSFLDAGTFAHDGRQAAALMQEAGVLIEGYDGFFYPSYVPTVSQAEPVFLRFIGAMQSKLFPQLPISSVAESAPVDNSWFDDACFIGHSQVVGMSQYFDLTEPEYYSVVGFKAQDVLDFTYFQGPDKGYGSLGKIFQRFPDHYRKVYIMLGINDCDIDDDRIERFLQPMRALMDLVTETQPNARVYLLSLAPVGRETPLNIAYNPANCMLYSQAIKSLSREYGAEYLDVYRLMADTEGYFLDSFNAGDGIHIKAPQYAVIEDFLKCHTGS